MKRRSSASVYVVIRTLELFVYQQMSDAALSRPTNPSIPRVRSFNPKVSQYLTLLSYREIELYQPVI